MYVCRDYTHTCVYVCIYIKCTCADVCIYQRRTLWALLYQSSPSLLDLDHFGPRLTGHQTLVIFLSSPFTPMTLQVFTAFNIHAQPYSNPLNHRASSPALVCLICVYFFKYEKPRRMNPCFIFVCVAPIATKTLSRLDN